MKILLLLLSLTPFLNAEPLKLTLPTDNRALLKGELKDYYMYVHRNFDGKASQPWTAGQYGFVRTLRRTEGDGIIATKFHEGIDIKPTKRDRNNNPLDKVRAIANGEVVYVNNNRGGSDYGIYIVIQHDWGYGPFYSLYAHLAKTQVEVGQRILGGSPIGTLGYTGAGLNRERAHLHLELTMLSTVNFSDWLGVESTRGLYDGRNLIGIDIASLFQALSANPKITIPQFLAGTTPYFKVAVPRTSQPLEIVQRYPWLAKGNHKKPSHSWEISFSDSGIPLAVVPSFRAVKKPAITFVRTTRSNHKYYTRGRVIGTGNNATLTKSGEKFIAFFTNEYTKPKATNVVK